jgi:hypothetical protein
MCMACVHELLLLLLSVPLLQVGLPALEAWDRGLAEQALAVYHQVAKQALAAASGYLVEAADGLCLAALCSPLAAAR